MRTTVLGLILAFGIIPLGAQTTAPTPATPPPPHAMQHDMMAHNMHQMQAQVSKMRATLDQMKANLNKITDPVMKQQAQFDVDLWEAMVHHMEMMSNMMAPHSGKGMGMGMGGMQPPPAADKPAQPQK